MNLRQGHSPQRKAYKRKCIFGFYKLFINRNERCRTTDAPPPSRMRKISFANVNNIRSLSDHSSLGKAEMIVHFACQLPFQAVLIVLLGLIRKRVRLHIVIMIVRIIFVRSRILHSNEDTVGFTNSIIRAKSK